MFVPNAIAVQFLLPAGAAEGCRMVLFAGDGYDSYGPTDSVGNPRLDWTNLNTALGTNWQGAAWTGLLNSDDIANGYVRYGFNNSYYGVVAGVVFDGPMGGIRTYNHSRNGSGATSRTLSSGTSPSTPQTGDYAIAFGSARVNAACSCDILTQLEALNSTDACGVLNGDVLGSTGAISANFTYDAGSVGDYQTIVVVQP
jgi:hypothetical protein